MVYEDEAMAGAAAAARACASGHRIGPFHGVPFALKDIVDVEGRITTGGSKTMLDRVSPATAIIARRLLAAGGILIGKTKTVEGTDPFKATLNSTHRAHRPVFYSPCKIRNRQISRIAHSLCLLS